MHDLFHDGRLYHSRADFLRNAVHINQYLKDWGATGFRSDVVATAKRDLKKGEMLDGEGGFCVWGKQTPADRSLDEGLLPLGLAHNVKLKRDVTTGEQLKWADVDYDREDSAVKVRREMEAAFGRRNV